MVAEEGGRLSEEEIQTLNDYGIETYFLRSLKLLSSYV